LSPDPGLNNVVDRVTDRKQMAFQPDKIFRRVRALYRQRCARFYRVECFS
jgi:hypothetical protein